MNGKISSLEKGELSVRGKILKITSKASKKVQAFSNRLGNFSRTSSNSSIQVPRRAIQQNPRITTVLDFQAAEFQRRRD